MHVLVLGAGVVGITSAWYLRQQGFEVTVVDRQAAAGLETSFANGGQISVSHAEPWANPAAPAKILKWLWREDAPLLFRLRADRQQWLWGLNFLRECTAERTRHNITQMVRLGTYSRQCLQDLRAHTGIEYDCLTRGILHFYTNPHEFDAALAPAQIMRELGCERRVIDATEAVRLEPALARIQDQIVGATYTDADESGDAHRFTQHLAALCAQAGVQFLYAHQIERLEMHDWQITGVKVKDAHGQPHTLKADRYVLCLGSYSPLLTRPLGMNLLIYPAKGYSATYPIIAPAAAPQVSMTDDEFKLVFSRLGNRLRVAGTAEMNGYNTELNLVRCEAITRRVLQICPDAVDVSGVQYWTGLRPATPSNVPYIGQSPIKNLYLNTGHGTLGWTHSCGSGQALAHLMAGLKPEVDFAFIGTAS
jgi:D-amino-acid dehydrogenase